MGLLDLTEVQFQPLVACTRTRIPVWLLFQSTPLPYHTKVNVTVLYLSLFQSHQRPQTHSTPVSGKEPHRRSL